MITAEKKAPRARKNTISVADYLTQQIGLSGKSQIQIAKEAGFNKPNIITMIKQGHTKLPTAKIGAMARSLGIDPIHLFRMCMQEYEPETWAALEEHVFKRPLVTEGEFEIIQLIRDAGVPHPRIRSDEDREAILQAAKQLKLDTP